ncbi:MAG: Maf family protein, partial [Pseudomonadota bacterium]
ETVGCYKVEGRGAQLFSRVQGDYFSVLGLPLLEILGFLRARGVLVE